MPAYNSQIASDRFRWMERLLCDPSLTDGAKCVGLRLALHLNLVTGLCNPGISALAEETGRSRRAVQKSIELLAKYVRRIPGGRGPKDTNSYELLKSDGSAINPHAERKSAPKNEQKGELVGRGERTDVRPNSSNISNIKTDTTVDGAAEAQCAIQADSLVRRIIELAELPRGPLPPYWINARAVAAEWLGKYPAEVILVGVEIAMTRRRGRGEHDPPASIRYFESPIEEAFKRTRLR